MGSTSDAAMGDAPAAEPAGRTELGARIRTRRLELRMTLVALAEAAELSHPFLSQVERGLASPSMASLQRVSRALGTSAVELLRAADDDRAEVESGVVRRGEGPEGPYGLGTARLLGPEALSFLPMEFSGRNVGAGELHVHEEAEFLAVIEGSVALDLDGERHVLEPGDAATIAAATPHRWSSADGASYRLLLVKETAGVAGLRSDLHRSVVELLEAGS